ncbi:MAG: glycosyltransferase family 4 protein [Lachnospiraceae bacterium]
MNKKKRLKILYYAFSCDPNYGSDEGIGWRWPYYMSKYHEVHVLVRKDRRRGIEVYCEKHDIHDIHFHYCDIPDCVNFYYKLGKGFLAYQFLWQFPAYRCVKNLHGKHQFNIIHHVSTNDFRLIGYIYRIKNVRYFLGPIGGAQRTPEGLNYYARKHKKEEIFRGLINYLFSNTRSYIRALNTAEHVFVSNNETLEYLSPKIKNKNKCSVFTEIGYDDQLLLEDMGEHSKDDDVTHFMWAGRVVWRKGLELLIDAICEISTSYQFVVHICGDGDIDTYRSYAKLKGVEHLILFHGKLNQDELRRIYQTSNALVFPSLRETTGSVIIEAMAQGLPVICIKQGGGALVVTDESGFLIDANGKEEYVKNFRLAMEACIVNKQKLETKSKKAKQRIEEHYLWSAKVEFMNRIY